MDTGRNWRGVGAMAAAAVVLMGGLAGLGRRRIGAKAAGRVAREGGEEMEFELSIPKGQEEAMKAAARPAVDQGGMARMLRYLAPRPRMRGRYEVSKASVLLAAERLKTMPARVEVVGKRARRRLRHRV